MERVESAGRWYDGSVYASLVDRMLAGVREYVADRLPPGDTVLDACCGTGALSMQLAQTGRTVLGVDISRRHIDFANARLTTSRTGVGSARFEVGDVTQVTPPPGGQFDVAVIVLALHEMPRDARRSVLARLTILAKRVMVVDFAAPMPRNLSGLRNRLMEVAAGKEHFSAFRDWMDQGGIDALIATSPANVECDRTLDAGTLRVVTLGSDLSNGTHGPLPSR